MRILQVNNINQIATIYSSELVQRGHAVAVYEPSLRGGSAPLPLKFATMPGRLFSLKSIVGRLTPNQFDILHIHWASYGILGLAGRIPFIVHCHGNDVRHRLQHILFRPLLTHIFRHAAAVMCVTPDLLPIVRAIRPDAIFAPGPIDTDQFAPAEHSRLPHPWTILLFARLDPEKGTAIALQGIAQFVQRHPLVHVKLIDWGLESEHYKQRYGSQFEFVPRVAPALAPHLIQSADVIIGQMACGALGLSELQAMSCGKPLIAAFRYADAYPIPPALCQATTAQAVAEHLEHLFAHPQVATELGAEARAWILAYHSHHTLAIEIEKLYQSIIRQSFNYQTR